MPHAIAISSCTSALHLAYLAAGIGPGDEVIVPGITFVATAAAARYCGAEPVLAEIAGQDDLGIDPEDVRNRITSRTKAVCAVHYGGYGAQLDELKAICAEHGIALLEDAAHSPDAFAEDGRTMLGTVGLAGPSASSRTRSSPAARVACSRRRRRGRRARAQPPLARDDERDLGPPPRPRLGYDVVGLGYNYRLDEPRAALLSARLPGLAADIEARRAVTHRYRELLGEIDGLELPYTDEEVARSSCYVMPVMLRTTPSCATRCGRCSPRSHKVQTTVLYPSISNSARTARGGPCCRAANGPRPRS